MEPMEILRSNDFIYDPSRVNAICDRFNVHPLAARTLLRRGYETDKQINQFLHPEDCPLPTWMDMPGTQEAAAIIKKAIAEDKSICIYGDYDADGVCASAILYRCLQKLGARVGCYIPSRHGEGYGMNEAAIHTLHERAVDLIVTVDNGISAVSEAALIKSLGMGLIITDHHRHGSELPHADAILSVSAGDFRERVGDMCGAGVAWLLASTLENSDGKEYLSLAAAATVADVVSLTKCNRAIVAQGLLTVKEQTGLQALLSIAGAGDIDETALGFIIAPRLNAAGRMAEATDAFELLITDDKDRAEILAQKLCQHNDARRNEENRILSECLAMAPDGGENPVLILQGEDWNVGVVGIVAARLTELFYKPAILLTQVHSGVYSGSARSIPEVDLFALLLEAKDTMVRFGGHAGAAGMTVLSDRMDAFVLCVQQAFLQLHPQGLPHKRIMYEDTASVEECSAEACQSLRLLAPFGQGNPEPVFRIMGHLSQVYYLGQGQRHLCAYLSMNGTRRRLVAFGQGREYTRWLHTDLSQAVCTLKMDLFRNLASCELICQHLSSVKDLKYQPEYSIIRSNFLHAVQDGDGVALRQAVNDLLPYFPVRLSEDGLRPVYVRFLRWAKEGKLPESVEDAAAALVFQELGFFEPAPELKPVIGCQKKSCAQSILYLALS